MSSIFKYLSKMWWPWFYIYLSLCTQSADPNPNPNIYIWFCWTFWIKKFANLYLNTSSIHVHLNQTSTHPSLKTLLETGFIFTLNSCTKSQYSFMNIYVHYTCFDCFDSEKQLTAQIPSKLTDTIIHKLLRSW